jgi:hypothetical protein
MAHFAQLNEQDIVITVNVVNNSDIDNLPFPESEPVGIAYLQNLYGPETVWKQTSYNGNFRVRYAGVGYAYSVGYDAFIPPQFYPSWLFNATILDWVAPVPYPDDGNLYVWDENTISWVQAT